MIMLFGNLQMKANVGAITASMPAPCKALTASSRDEPLPNPRSATLVMVSLASQILTFDQSHSHDSRPISCFLSENWPIVLKAVTAQFGVIDTRHKFSRDNRITTLLLEVAWDENTRRLTYRHFHRNAGLSTEERHQWRNCLFLLGKQQSQWECCRHQ